MKRKLKFTEAGHRYTLDGKTIPSLSSILDFWFGEYRDYTNGAAADRGTRIHRACEYAVRGCLNRDSLASESENLSGYVDAFENFFLENPEIAKGKPTTEFKTHITHPEGIEENYREIIKCISCGMRLDLVFRQSNTVIEIKSGIPTKKNYWEYSREQMQLNTQIKAISSKRKPTYKWQGYLLYVKADGSYQSAVNFFDSNIWGHFLMAWHGWYNKNMEV